MTTNTQEKLKVEHLKSQGRPQFSRWKSVIQDQISTNAKNKARLIASILPKILNSVPEHPRKGTTSKGCSFKTPQHNFTARDTHRSIVEHVPCFTFSEKSSLLSLASSHWECFYETLFSVLPPDPRMAKIQNGGLKRVWT